MKVDFHIHTCYSDGSLTPEEIVRRYRANGYDEIAITDHDTTDGVTEAVRCAAEMCAEKSGAVGTGESCARLVVVPGIEISTVDADGVETHILGHYIDIKNAALRARLEDLRRARRARNEKLIAYLAEQGYPLTYEELLVGKRGDYIGKPDFGRAMVRKGYIKEAHEVFTPGKFLETPGAKRIKKEKISTDEAIRLITGAGGRATLAHPIQIKEFGVPGSEEYFARLEPFVIGLKEKGLAGIEAYHPDQNEEQSERFAALAEKLGLIVTRGSDFHGDDIKRKKRQ